MEKTGFYDMGCGAGLIRTLTFLGKICLKKVSQIMDVG